MLKRSKKFRILLQSVTNKKMLSYKSGPFREIAIDNVPRNKIWENRDRIKMSNSNMSNSISESSLNSQMKDEYGKMDDEGESYHMGSFQLESGVSLRNAQVRYKTYGKLNDAKDNVLVVCHALTGNASLDTWWGGLLGPDKAFDTDKYFVVCANVVGSCYGSSGPQTIDPLTSRPYGIHFPEVTIRDTVSMHIQMVKLSIGAMGIACVIGGSMGGMHCLEWILLGGSFVKSAVVIGCGKEHTAWQIGISEVQRQAIYGDPNWKNGDVDPETPPSKGLAIARQFAMLTYRTPQGFQSKFKRDKNSDGDWETKKYLEYQGKKFLARFDAITYVKLTEQMDTHDVGRSRGGAKEALGQIKCPVLIMGINSDLLYPLSEQEELASLIPNSEFQVIDSTEGHDGFLLEQEQVGSNITNFLNCNSH